ncbi:SET domain-containing protein [Pseudoxanthomonas suwonensis]|uniref:SET domain-containing protein n=1 Tax=Pseudoxanthomonas suwonensis TaxID=314722 RepID=UPI00138F299E|nr:SET domain-containing protein-lysine N-methyltransferase [Pseudoxanthomonas suwonensis]KAF1704907.1 SET domain-containing protein-lysine N-methyltransferase [Pseudoxanthomonas suwonensis]
MPRKIVARKSPIHGNGVFAVEPIRKGERVIEYKGLRRTHDEVDADSSGDVESGHTFLFTLNDEYVVDANYKGNDARWINHSCDPNCEAVVVEHDGDDRSKDRIFIEAIRNIRPGEELTYNYGITLAERHTARLKKIWACRCGSPRCTGTMLQPKR